jgi:hypothetical protein
MIESNYFNDTHIANQSATLTWWHESWSSYEEVQQDGDIVRGYELTYLAYMIA